MIKNFKMTIDNVDGSGMDMDFKNTKDLIHHIYTNDFAAPPNVVILSATDENGNKVNIRIPYGKYDEVFVKILPNTNL